MLEKTLQGDRSYWAWVSTLLVLVALGLYCYLHQLQQGLGVTGLSRDVSWGLYIAQFTFLVGVAASAVMVVLPYYLHDVREFSRITILGELLAVAAVIMCMLFIFADMGQPARVLNVLLHPSPNSLMFWDMVSLTGYLVLNAVSAFTLMKAEQQRVPPPSWAKPVILLSIPWAFSIHTVTAFLYSGLPGRALWFSAVLAPRFLASAFASGPALLILICLWLRRCSSFDAGRGAIGKLSVLVAYAMSANVFLLGVELFTALYGNKPEHREPFAYLYLGLGGERGLVPVMWLSALLALGSLVVLLAPRLRGDERWLAPAAGAVFVSLLLEKGVGLIVAGFQPSPFGRVARYVPTVPELGIVLGIWALGALLVTVFYKALIAVREAND